MGTTRVHGPHSHSERGSTLHTFSAEASASLAGPGWLRERRAAGYEAFASSPLPSESEEVWRYSPIDRLALDDFGPELGDGLAPAGEELQAAVEAALGPRWRAASSCTTGAPVHLRRRARRRRPLLRAGRGRGGITRHARLGAARRRRPRPPERRVRARPGVRRRAGRRRRGRAGRARPLVRPGAATFPRSQRPTPVRAPQWRSSRSSPAAPGPDRSLIVPVTELAADGGRLAVLRVAADPRRGGLVDLARLAARVTAASAVRTFTVGLGGGL